MAVDVKPGMATRREDQTHHGGWVLGREDKDGGFLLEPWFVCDDGYDIDTRCARRMLDDHGVCGRPAATTFMGESLPGALDERDVLITCSDCAALLVSEGLARPVTIDVGRAASHYFWQVQRERRRRGLSEQAVRA